MARPRLYHTPEEIRVANNAKSKRSYVKNQPTVRVRRNLLYRRKAKESIIAQASPPMAEVQHIKGPLAYWCDRVERIATKHAAIVGLSPSDYVETLYVQFSISNDDCAIQDAVSRMTKLQSSIRRYHAEILQLEGVGKELGRCDEVSKMVSGVLASLEDLLSSAILDPTGLAALHKGKQLMYQQ
ncbi:hypothetical protein FPV67DRAFT_1449874 [Lyophyllum atratum]|nr:hypothetical protein FPV67DRAFT_1449874 [Lyophyllum atratum]